MFIWLFLHEMIGNGENTLETIRMDKIRVKKALVYGHLA